MRSTHSAVLFAREAEARAVESRRRSGMAARHADELSLDATAARQRLERLRHDWVNRDR